MKVVTSLVDLYVKEKGNKIDIFKKSIRHMTSL